MRALSRLFQPTAIRWIGTPGANLRDRKEAFARSRPEDCKARVLSLCAARKPPIRRGWNGRDRSEGRHVDIEDSSSFDDLRLPRRDQPSSPHDVIEGWVPVFRFPGIHAGEHTNKDQETCRKPHLLGACRRIPPTGPAGCAAITRWQADALAATGLASGRSLRPWPATRRFHTAGLRYPIHGR
jgi:hypothetical protein